MYAEKWCLPSQAEVRALARGRGGLVAGSLRAAAWLLLLATGVAGAADRIDVNQLPPAVKKSLDTTVPGGTVNSITVSHVEGKEVYDIEVARKHVPASIVRIAENGQVLRDSSAVLAAAMATPIPEYGAPPISNLPLLGLNELPDAAQRTITRVADGRSVTRIEQGNWNGRAGYRVTFRESGRNPQLTVAADGSVLQPQEKPPGLSTLYLGTRFEDTPPAVQATIRRELRDGEITRIEREKGRGESMEYKIELRDAHGPYSIRVNATGQLLENSRATERPLGKG